MDDARDLHKARNLEQFTFLSELKMKKWQDIYMQPEAAKWFEDTYLVPQWRCWYVSASGTPGVFPSTQHLESMHNRMKSTDLHSLRCTIQDLLAHVLQDVLRNHAVSLVRDSIHCTPSEIPCIYAQEATLIVQHNGEDQANFNGQVLSPRCAPEALYFNVRPVTLDKIPKNHRNVTEERMQRHEAGLRGSCEGITDDLVFRREYMGLYKVWWCDQREMTVCECKSFWRLKRCPHALVFEHQVLQQNSVSMALEKICRVKSNKKIGYKKWQSDYKKDAHTSSVTKSKAKVSLYPHTCMHMLPRSNTHTHTLEHMYTYMHTHTWTHVY